MSDTNPYTPPLSNIENNNQEIGPKGLGGWLILVAIIIIVTPISIASSVYKDLYLSIFTTDVWELTTNPSSEFYTPFFKTTLIFELLINLIMIIVWLIVITLFFSKRRLFKTFFLGILIASPIILIIDAIIGGYVMNVVIFDADTTKDIVRTIISATIWSSYTLRSKRVANTFIK